VNVAHLGGDIHNKIVISRNRRVSCYSDATERKSTYKCMHGSMPLTKSTPFLFVINSNAVVSDTIYVVYS